MTSDIARARWWLAYPVAICLLALLDFALDFWHPFPARLPEQFSPAYLSLYLRDVPRGKPVVAFLGDSVLWGYKINQTDSAVADLQRDVPGAQMLNLSYEGGSIPNSEVMLRTLLHSGLRPAGIVLQINVKEFNQVDSAYRTLHPSLERAATDLLTPDDRRVLQMHAPTDLNAKLNRFVERIWRFYRFRSDLREQIFGTDDMAGALVNAAKRITGTAAAEELAHRPTTEKFLGTYDLAPIDRQNVGMEYYQQLMRELCAAKVPTLVFLTPTNHRLLHDYIDVPEYDENLRRLMAVPHCGAIRIVNLDRLIPSRMFLDNDHLDRDGQRILAARLLPHVRSVAQ